MKPVTNIHVLRSGQAAMAAICLSMALYVITQMVIG